MSRVARKLIPPLLFLAVLTVACSRQGSEYLGKWVNTTKPSDTMEITRNGEQYLLSGKVPATYKDGALQVAGPFGTITLTYIKSSDTLVLYQGAGILSERDEFKRVK